MQAVSLSQAIGTTREFVDTTNGIVHVDEVLYPLFIQAIYPNHVSQTESFIEFLYQIWLDPSPEHIVFLPDFIQDKFVYLPDFMEVVSHVYPEHHYEKTAFLDFTSEGQKVSSALLSNFAEELKSKQRQKLWEQGVRIVGVEDAIDYDGSHMILLTYQQKLPTYNGETRIILIEDTKNKVFLRPEANTPEVEPISLNDLPSVLPIQSVKLLFNDPELFHERYVLNLRPPYQPSHHIGIKTLKEFLLLNKPIKTQTVFDQLQVMRMKEDFEKFKATLPKDVIWNKEVIYDVPDIKKTLHGTIDLIWDGGLYQLIKRTPPPRSALLNGTEPELPLLAAAFPNVTHVGYIYIKGHGEDAITITRYNDASALVSENIKKLAHYYSGSQEKST
jgi:hypothetical protein